MNLGQQFPVAPTVQVHMIVSDPANQNKYKQVPVADVLAPVLAETRAGLRNVTDETYTLKQSDIDNDVVTISIPRANNMAVSKCFHDINGKFNVGVTSTFVPVADDVVTATIVGFADECSAGDDLGLMLFWKYEVV